jgi:hypothetical protein
MCACIYHTYVYVYVDEDLYGLPLAVCMYVCVYVSIRMFHPIHTVWVCYVCLLCVYACVYVCVYACVYVGVYVCICVYVFRPN